MVPTGGPFMCFNDNCVNDVFPSNRLVQVCKGVHILSIFHDFEKNLSHTFLYTVYIWAEYGKLQKL